jgi:hypothetical protein
MNLKLGRLGAGGVTAVGGGIWVALGCVLVLAMVVRLVQSFVRPRPALIRRRWETAGWAPCMSALTLSVFGDQHRWLPSQPRDALQVAAFMAAGAGMLADVLIGRRRSVREAQ